MLVLGIETSCDETGIALYDTDAGLLGHTLYTQAKMHQDYGGVVPELASRDHIRRVLPLTDALLAQTARTRADINAIAYTQGPGLAGALLVGAAIANGLAFALDVPALGVHHLEGHLLSPLLSEPRPPFPFLALLVSGGHTQLMRVSAIGDYELLGETVDDAAGEAFDKIAKLLGLGYPGGPALAALAATGDAKRFKLPRPKIDSPDLDFSFSGLKTAVATLLRNHATLFDSPAARTDLAASVQAAIVAVLSAKALAALRLTGVRDLVVAGGVGANRRLRESLSAGAQRAGFRVYYPPLEFCTDNGAMIALVGALRLTANGQARAGGTDYAFSVAPRWELARLAPVGGAINNG